MPKDILECERCGNRWASEASGQKVTCTHCGYKTERYAVGQQVFIRGKFLYTDCETIDDMITATEERLELLRHLKDSGYTVSDPDALTDDYCYLWKETPDDSDTE